MTKRKKKDDDGIPYDDFHLTTIDEYKTLLDSFVNGYPDRVTNIHILNNRILNFSDNMVLPNGVRTLMKRCVYFGQELHDMFITRAKLEWRSDELILVNELYRKAMMFIWNKLEEFIPEKIINIGGISKFFFEEEGVVYDITKSASRWLCQICEA